MSDKAKRRTAADLIGWGLVAVIGLVVLAALGRGPTPAEQAAAAEAAAAEEAACRADAQCWGERHMTAAGIACALPIERLAAYDFDWNVGMGSPRFLRWMVTDRDKGTLVYLGDAIRLQNGFGAWVPHTYRCVYEPTTDTAVEVSAAPGRMPQ